MNNLFYMRLVLIILLFPKLSLGSSNISYPYQVNSLDGMSYLKSIPFSSFEGTKLGISKIYKIKKNGDSELLYTLNNYLNSHTIICNNEKKIFSINLFGNYKHSVSDTIINFYCNGHIKKSYSLMDLQQYIYESNALNDKSTWGFKPDFTNDSISSFLKFNNIFFINDTLCVIFSDKHIRFFDIETGDYIGKTDYLDFMRNRKLSDFKKIPSMVYNYDVKYPDHYNFLKNKKRVLINNELINLIADSVLQNLAFIQISGIMNLNGKCKNIAIFLSSNERLESYPLIENEIKKYIYQASFETEELPPDVKYWQFTHIIPIKKDTR